jgi:hypothetical protein
MVARGNSGACRRSFATPGGESDAPRRGSGSPASSGAQTLAALPGTDVDTDGVTEPTRSVANVDASSGDVTGADSGFHLDTIVGPNDTGLGTLYRLPACSR